MNLLSRSMFALRRWWLSRRWRLLLPGLPALAVGFAAVVLVGIAMAQNPRDITARYHETAKQKLRDKDAAGAMTCYERLATQGAGQREDLFGLALAAERLGHFERAIVLMRQLAPTEGGGYAEAHLWWAKYLYRSVGVSPDTLDLVERHLLHAIDGRVGDREVAHGLLGELYLNKGALEKAEPHLHKAVEVNPQLQLRLAQLYYAKGDQRQGRLAAEHAMRFFKAWSSSELYALDGRRGLADAHILLGDFPSAVAVLIEGLKLTNDIEYRQALSRVYIGWAQKLANDKSDSVGEQLELIEKAMALTPDNPELVMRVWAMLHSKGKQAEQAYAVLRKQLSSGKATAMTHLALGTRALEGNKLDEALVHLEQAYKLEPNMALVANNLAWVLANSRPPDLKRALSLMDSVLDRFPRVAMFRDTRGFIHVRMGSWKAALTDYQVALPGYAHLPQFHKQLAEVYTKLEMKDMAAEHLKRVEEILEKAKKDAAAKK